jgi:hypothetical protein
LSGKPTPPRPVRPICHPRGSSVAAYVSATTSMHLTTMPAMCTVAWQGHMTVHQWSRASICAGKSRSLTSRGPPRRIWSTRAGLPSSLTVRPACWRQVPHYWHSNLVIMRHISVYNFYKWLQWLKFLRFITNSF